VPAALCNRKCYSELYFGVSEFVNLKGYFLFDDNIFAILAIF
jgi:hypothetical protein